MKILAIAETFFPERPTGLARVAWDVCRSIAKRGHEVHLLCPSFLMSTDIETNRIENVQVSRFPQPKTSAYDPRNPRNRINAYKNAIALIGDPLQWNVIHCHGIYATLAAAETSPARAPIVQTIHSPAVLEQLWNWTHQGVPSLLKLPAVALIHRLESAALSTATICHSLSHYTRYRIQDIYPRTIFSKWATIPHWVDDTWKRQHPANKAKQLLGWDRTQRIILTVRQLRPRYGIEDAINAVQPLVADGKCRLYIVGDGESRSRLERLAKRTEANASIHFTGQVSEAKLRLIYQAADVFLLPSRALECFGIIAQEAMAFGLPVVASCVGSLPEILSPITPQLLAPPKAPHRLSQLLRQALDKKPPIASPQQITSYVQKKYSEHRVADEYETMLLSAAR